MKDTIMITQNVFSKDECEQIINNVPIAVERYTNVDYKVTMTVEETNNSNRQDNQFNGHMILSTVKDKGDYLLTRLKDSLNGAIDLYAKQFPIINDFFIDKCGIWFDGYKVQRTNIGEGFHQWHFEDAELRTRFLVWTIFLNDVDEGGETEFLYKNTRVPAKQGSLCLFPSDWTHLHRGNPPISNEKWIMTGWYEYNYRGASGK
mgnify:CR=1 FL=1|tara:strand:- start:678 stop:1289 length:612 start_codon:yes stop_codon:yes gene_type:complete